DEDGDVTSWAVEFGAPYSLLQKGLRRTDFEIGTEVVINGFLAKSGEPVLNASNVTLPDGRDFLTGAEDSPGAGAVPDPATPDGSDRVVPALSSRPNHSHQ